MMTLITVKQKLQKKIQTQIIYRFRFKICEQEHTYYLTNDSYYVHEKRIFYN